VTAAQPDAPLIAVVDYGMGNRRSVEKALLRVGARVERTAQHDRLLAADGLLLPGVGAVPAAMRAIRALDLDGLLRERAAAGTPLLGACMGMQLLFDGSEEHGGAEALGIVAGSVRRLRAPGRVLPHVGWSEVAWTRPHPLVEGLPDPTALYHVHTFACHPSDEDVVLGWAEHGERFASVIAQGSVFGAQSHPEKSSTHGLALLANFARLCARVKEKAST
jgi:imidazole glycerol-phosphate synthase subunit HisH